MTTCARCWTDDPINFGALQFFQAPQSVKTEVPHSLLMKIDEPLPEVPSRSSPFAKPQGADVRLHGTALGSNPLLAHPVLHEVFDQSHPVHSIILRAIALKMQVVRRLR